MNNNILSCAVEMFSNSTIFYNDGTKEVVPNEVLVDVLIPKCYSLGYDTIHFFGDEGYINGIVNNLMTEQETSYSEHNKIKIEVN